MLTKYDLIVVGGGHAGCEAAHAAAKMGSHVLLVTMDLTRIAQMSCNPAMGGVAKGQIIREIDAMGGMSGIVSDKTAVQFRMLNLSKGPAMWSPRTQNDRGLFAKTWREILEKNHNIDFWQEMVKELIIENNQVKGVKTGLGLEIYANSVVLTNGTFLNGTIHIGEKQIGGGRASEKSSTGLTEQLESFGFDSGRMKTGTPPRLDGRSINYDLLEEQKGDEKVQNFSFKNFNTLETQLSCYITYTSPEVHDTLRKGFERSPMFNGRIQSQGPRYCPSVEDKIHRFADKERHQLFVEPEGWDTIEVYVNGFSTSLPEDIQFEALRKIRGFENVKMFRPGYAIEYDYFPPIQLKHTLETKLIDNLFFAGQINGTTGYEEAACQGLMAGINAHLNVNNMESFTLSRSESYIGVLIDDLINKGTEEPYRMFTSRAEYRILLRQDNADLRLTEKSYNLGLAEKERLDRVKYKEEQIEKAKNQLPKIKFKPEEINERLKELNLTPIKEKYSLQALLKRPKVDIHQFRGINEEMDNFLIDYDNEVLEQVSINLKYKEYIDKERKMADKLNDLDNIYLNGNIDFKKIPALSNEAVEKLEKIKPETLGSASRISGIKPTDISVLMVYLNK